MSLAVSDTVINFQLLYTKMARPTLCSNITG